MRRHPKRQPAPSYHPIATGPARLPKELGDRITLDNGLELILIYIEDMTPIFRAQAAGSTWHQMWTSHMDRPGLYIRVGDWPRGPKACFDTDDAIDRALDAQLIAETMFDLDKWTPLDVRRALSSEEVA